MAVTRRSPRKILIILAERGGKLQPMPWTNLPANMSWGTLKLALMTHPNWRPQQAGVDSRNDVSDFKQYDYYMRELHDHATVSQIPEPGIVVLSNIRPDDTQNWQGLLAEILEMHNQPFCKDFLNSPAARYIPDPPSTHDVFLGYAGEDEDAAFEIQNQLRETDITCFTAKFGIGAGAVWTENLREALFGCRLGLLLLTPNSFNKPWLMCEAGALWALERHIVPALRHVKLEDLPEIISRHQARVIETSGQQQDLISEIRKILRD